MQVSKICQQPGDLKVAPMAEETQTPDMSIFPLSSPEWRVQPGRPYIPSTQNIQRDGKFTQFRSLSAWPCLTQKYKANTHFLLQTAKRIKNNAIGLSDVTLLARSRPVTKTKLPDSWQNHLCSSVHAKSPFFSRSFKAPLLRLTFRGTFFC